jgi:predicted dehydrogenase
LQKIVIIGTSPIVSFHIKALREVGLEPIAIASSNLNSTNVENFAIKNKISKFFPNWKKMLDEQKYDGILIATKIEHTIEILEESIKYNIPILVEKPVSFDSKSLEKILQVAHDKIMVGYNRRYYRTVKHVKKNVDTKKEFSQSSMIAPETPTIRKFFDNTSHCIDMLHFIFGEIHLEFVKKIIFNDQIRGVVAIFSTEQNDTIQFTGNWGTSDNFSLSTYIGKKKLELRPFEKLKTFEGMDIMEPTEESPIRKYIPKKIETIELETIDGKIKPGFYQQAREFAQMIKTGSKSENAASLIDAKKTIEICENLIGKYTK